MDADEHERASSAPDLDDIVRGLDLRQWAAVTSPAPLLAVIAGAGSGKTGVLTRRVAYRCLTATADPSHVAVLTFTRQAAAELRRRLWSLGLRDSITAGTFHSVALSLLKQRWDDQRRPHPVVVSDRRRLIAEVLGRNHSGSLNAISSDVDWARSRNISPDGYAGATAAASRRGAAPATEVARVLADIETLKRRRGVIDLDDLLSLVVRHMHDDPAFASSVRWRLRHLFVDEAQDLNPLQSMVLDLWREGRDDLTLVGDPSQSVYGFNGADPTVLLELERRFPGVEVIRLDTNYRCTPQVVRAGLAVLSHLDAAPPALESGRPDGPTVASFTFDDEHAECEGVARMVRDLRSPAGSYRGIAVLARTNAQLAPMRSALERAGVPARILGSTAADPVQRAVREVGELSSGLRIAAWARDVRFGLDGTEDPDPDDDDRRARLIVAGAVGEFLADEGGDGRAFLAWVRANRPFDDSADPTARGSVELLTFHGAKGREWTTVIVTGCEKGLMPHSSARTPVEFDEEVRLAYVAVTRAADRLLLTRAAQRRGRTRTSSPFTSGIDLSPSASAPSADFVRDELVRRGQRHAPDPILSALTEWRRRVSRSAGVDPAFICPNDVLRRIAAARPIDLEHLASIDGVGHVFASRVGPRLLAAIAQASSTADDRA